LKKVINREVRTYKKGKLEFLFYYTVSTNYYYYCYAIFSSVL